MPMHSDQGSLRSFVSQKIVSALNADIGCTDIGIKALGNVIARQMASAN